LLLARSPAKANEDVRDSLSETQRASLQNAEELGQRYAANPATAAIWEHLIGLVQQVRGLQRMLLWFCKQCLKGLWDMCCIPQD
jgi:hypothetical protein